jgi:molybdopterin/thiamine biosynthesis adenylyltransferase
LLRPRVKPEHRAYRTVDGNVRIGGVVFGIGAEVEDPEGWVWTLTQALDGTRSPAEAVGRVTARHPRVPADRVRTGYEQLLAAGFVEDAGAPPPACLTGRERERYSRQMPFFRWIDLGPRPGGPWQVQLRLRAARVLLLGVGGTGGAVAQALVASGVGALHLVDPDVVELSNLGRQVLYREADLGRPKADAARERLSAINSEVRVTSERREVRSRGDLEGLLWAGAAAGAGADRAGAAGGSGGAGRGGGAGSAGPASGGSGPGGAPGGRAPDDRGADLTGGAGFASGEGFAGDAGSAGFTGGGPGGGGAADHGVGADTGNRGADSPAGTARPPYDLFVLAADRPARLRRWANRACLAAGLPWVSGGYHGPLAVAAVHVPGQGPCWECVRAAELERRDLRAAPGRDQEIASPRMPWQPVNAVSALLSGGLVAHAALALLTGAPPLEPGVRFGVNLMVPGDPVLVSAPWRPECPACGEAAARDGRVTPASCPDLPRRTGRTDRPDGADDTDGEPGGRPER